MITDTERREVARKLQELDYSDLQESLICAYLDALGVEGYEDWVGIAHRLADLIEPDGKGIESEAFKPVESDGISRDALLALADEMDMDASCYAYVDDYNVNVYARRIREALGE